MIIHVHLSVYIFYFVSNAFFAESSRSNFFSNNTLNISANCVPFAFADFDSDKIIEIYCAIGNEISIIKFDPTIRLVSTVASTQLSHNYVITGMLAADLDGDSIVDTVVLYSDKKDHGFVSIIWGNNDNLSDWKPLPYRFYNWPIVTSVFENSVELFGSVFNHSIGFVSCGFNRTFSFKPLNRTIHYNLNHLSTQSLVDLTGDMVADLFITNADNSYEIWSIGSNQQLNLEFSYKLPTEIFINHVYPSVFLDVDAFGRINQVVPVCFDNMCSRIDLLIRRDKTWNSGLINQSLPEGWRLINLQKNTGFWGSTPLVLKVADVNLDNYPDLLGICEHKDSGDYALVFFMNVEHNNRRSFVAEFHNLLRFKTPIIVAAFFDLEENGFSDILMCSKGSDNKYQLAALENNGAQDAYFFKVMVVGGGCRKNGCPVKNLPRGDNQVAVSTILEITSKKGHIIHMIAAQSTHNSIFALQLPYVTFGLGDLPSFVEYFEISAGRRIPANSLLSSKSMEISRRKWSQMIPNSQILVVPYPLTDPAHWHTRLYINPSRLIFYIGITLAVLCIVVLSLVIALQVKEKQEDDSLKKSSQQFRCDTL